MSNNGKIRQKSPLVTYERISPNSSRPRKKQIRRLSPHCIAGNLTIETALGLPRFVNSDPANGASCNYAIGSDGRIGLGVAEVNRSWCTSSPTNDHESITFEIANDSLRPDWHMSEAAINTWMNVAVDIAKFYGFSKFNYQPKPNNISGENAVESWISSWANPDEMIITLHCWYKAKACPGPYLIRQLPWIVKEMNKRLNGLTPEAFVGEGSTTKTLTSTTTTTKPNPPTTAPAQSNDGLKEYSVRVNTVALNVRKGPGVNFPVVKTLANDKNVYTIIKESFGPGANKWGELKSGLGWLSLDYTTKV